MRRVLLVLSVVLSLISLSFSTVADAQHRRSGGSYHRTHSSRPYYGGGHHTSSHGGHYSGGHGSSHKGGHYRNARTGNHYGRHK